VAEFDALLPAFTDRFEAQMQSFTLAGKPRQRPYVSYSNSPLPTMAGKLLFILVYLRKATTQDIFGVVFGMAQPIANQWIQRLYDGLNQALGKLGVRPARQADDLDLADDAVKRYFQAGPERPIPRPKAPEFRRPSTVARRNTTPSRTTCWSTPKARLCA